MSSKRKDSQPSRANPTQEGGEDSNTGDDEPSVGQISWPAFASSLGVQRPMGQQVSQLGQLLAQHNGGRSVSPPRMDFVPEDSNMGDDSSSIGGKDDDDENDDDDDLEDTNGHDPDRLKAFNMFVRLFVDENLDRHVPISKQPKEKIHAIIDSCTRQFPEYSERARKRIRTYLKSCRRTKRSREQAGLDARDRPTPPHLTSVMAEQVLARACENEAENAKRMRMGMELVSQPMPVTVASSSPPPSTISMARQEQLVNLLSSNSAQRPQNLAPGPMFGTSPIGLLQANGVGGDKKPPLLTHKLSVTEMQAVRQLITGYRESAAFLLRSADELEHLLQVQPKL